jgi:hypothetical protein
MDSQVKIRGFRVELGEVEATLLQHPEIHQAAVRVWTDDQNNRRLVAYVVLAQPLSQDAVGVAIAPQELADVRSHLQQTLPDYMLPSLFVPLNTLPLLPNGKLNRKALPVPILPDKSTVPILATPQTEAEQHLLTIWQDLLRQPVGLHDNFFELGGDSILAIQAIAKAQQVGLSLSPRDLFQYSTVAQLAAVSAEAAKSNAATQSSTNFPSLTQQSPIIGSVPLTPIQHWFFEQQLEHPHHWNQSVLLRVKQALQLDLFTQALRQLMHHHDALRATFYPTESGWQQHYQAPSDAVPLIVIQQSVDDVAQTVGAIANSTQASLDLEQGPLLKVVYFDLMTTDGPERRLLILCHHLIVDGISWRILLSDLQILYQQLVQMNKAQLLSRTVSCSQWVNQLMGMDKTSELAYWQRIVKAEVSPLPQDFTGGSNRMEQADAI